MSTIQSADYHDYYIKDGKFIGEFEQMYQSVADPWFCTQKVNSLDNDLFLALVQHAAPTPANVFDLGCGLGTLTNRIQQALPQAVVHACDVSPTAIEKARAQYADIHFFVHDANHVASLPFEPGSLDLIMMSQLMWCILTALPDLLPGLYRRLKPNGSLIVLQYFLDPAEQKYGKGIIDDASDFIRLVHAAGFHIEREIYLNRQPPQNLLLWAVKKLEKNTHA